MIVGHSTTYTTIYNNAQRYFRRRINWLSLMMQYFVPTHQQELSNAVYNLEIVMAGRGCESPLRCFLLELLQKHHAGHSTVRTVVLRTLFRSSWPTACTLPTWGNIVKLANTLAGACKTKWLPRWRPSTWDISYVADEITTARLSTFSVPSNSSADIDR